MSSNICSIFAGPKIFSALDLPLESGYRAIKLETTNKMIGTECLMKKANLLNSKTFFWELELLVEISRHRKSPKWVRSLAYYFEESESGIMIF